MNQIINPEENWDEILGKEENLYNSVLKEAEKARHYGKENSELLTNFLQRYSEELDYKGETGKVETLEDLKYEMSIIEGFKIWEGF